MEKAQKEIERLAANLKMTSLEDDEPYILTPEEEAAVIRSAIDYEKKRFVWKMREAQANEFQIESRLKNTDWEKLLDKEELFRKANSAKHYENWIKEKRLQEMEAIKRDMVEKQKRCSADYMFKLMARNCREKTGAKLIVDERTSHLIRTLCFFFSNDPRFESELGYTFSKGLFLRGVCGLGKTFLIDLLSANELKPVFSIGMKEIVDEVRSNGEYDPPICSILNLDDVGAEEHEVFFYKTRINWFRDFIEKYYKKQLPFNRLIISTNNSFEELESKHGYRVRDRFRQMFNIVTVKGESLRK